MGQLQARYNRRAQKAAGGLFGALAKKVVGTAARTIPGVGLATTGIGMAKAMLPKPKATFGLGLASGMAAGPVTKAATKVATTTYQKATEVFTGGRKKYRRQNVGNMKALRRAIRRIQGAEKLFRQVLSVQGKAHAGIKPKKGRR
jgi:hypothetical protein